MKQSEVSNLSIPRTLKNIIRARAASNNMFVAEYLSTLILKELNGTGKPPQGGAVEISAGSSRATQQPQPSDSVASLAWQQ